MKNNTDENVFDFSTALKDCHAECTVPWRVPADLPYLQGHFPGMPIVPAVAMIDASLVLVQQYSKQPNLRLKNVKQAKFMSPIAANDDVVIHCRAGKDGLWDLEWKNLEGQILVRLSLLMI